MKMQRSISSPVISISIKVVAALIFSILLVGCGGGGGGGGNSSSSAAANVAPTANAGEDLTVNAGATVELVAGGTDSDGTITGNAWAQLSGPKVSLQAVDLNAAHFTFVAPSAGTQDSINVEFRLTVTDNKGATGTDTVTFTVNRVNQPPVVNFSENKTVKGLTEVSLTAQADDPDGSVESYAWTQTGGPAVAMQNTEEPTISFTAPSTNETVELSFLLTVTDNDEATGSNTVVVLVTPENAPTISLTFPPQSGVYRGDHISAFGNATAKNGATIASISVNAGSDVVIARVEEDGGWRADNIPVGGTPDNFTIEILAVDSEGIEEQASTTLSKTALDTGSGDKWKKAKLVAVVPGSDDVYVFTTGDFMSDVKVVPVNVKTGYRGASITNFNDPTQGTQNAALKDMIYDVEEHRFLFSNNPTLETGTPQIIAIDIATGGRSVISNPAKGEGASFVNPIGITWGSNNRLLVADNILNTIFSVDVATGDRVVIADENTMDVGVDAPLHVVWDSVAEKIIVIPNLLTNHYFLSIEYWNDAFIGSIFSADNSSSGPALSLTVQDVVVDDEHNRLIVLDGNDSLISVNLSTGARALLGENITDTSFGTALNKNMEYDSVNKLLYIVDGNVFSNGLFVVDPQSGSSVLLSH